MDGCICPIKDNCYGEGYYKQPGVFVITKDCPLHGNPGLSPTHSKWDSLYGYCPICGEEGRSRERRPNGNDTCVKGHVYPSKDAMH